MNFLIRFTNSVPHTMPMKKTGGTSAFSSPTDVLWIILLVLIIVVFLVGVCTLTIGFTRKMEVMAGKDVPMARIMLTPTQKFILAASSPTIGNNYKCVIDIWDTHLSDAEIDRVIKLFEWGWGDFTYENAKKQVDECMNGGYNLKYKDYCSLDASSPELASKYTDFQLQLLKEMKQKYPEQGMLAWDLVRVLSIVGGAYMGGIMEYEEAVKIAFEACKRLQENFTSWDDMVGNYTLGYQFWRGKRQKDRWKYYKKLKRNWIFKIAWNTELKESDIYNEFVVEDR